MVLFLITDFLNP